MRRAGGLIALIAGIFGTIAAILTLIVGGLGAAIKANGVETIVQFGIGGLAFSFVVIVLGAIAMNAHTRLPGLLLIPCSLAGALLGGTLVAVCMALALIGGILAAIPRREPSISK